MTAEKSGEFRGKTIELAISAGLAALRLAREEVQIEIVRPGSRGVLGIGAEDAIVRLTSARPGRSDTGAGQEGFPAPAAAQVSKPEPGATARPEAASPPKLEPPAAKTQPTTVPRPSGAATPRSERKTTPRPQPKPEAAKVSRPKPAAEDDRAAEAAQQGREFLLGLLERMALQADVEIVPQSDAESDADERVDVLNIIGDDLGVLIGRQNEVLSALEFITRLMVNQHSRARSSFVIDVNGYRAKRAESLRKLALRTAEQVIETARTMALEPMPPAERRIIHLALRDHPKVFTQSVGEGDRRKVTVIPKREA